MVSFTARCLTFSRYHCSPEMLRSYREPIATLETLPNFQTAALPGCPNQGMNILPANKKCMETTITTGLDQAIENYKSTHGNKPLYCIMSAEEADQLTDILKKDVGDTNVIITSYRDIKIVRDEFMEPGTYSLGNELPDTGS